MLKIESCLRRQGSFPGVRNQHREPRINNVVNDEREERELHILAYIRLHPRSSISHVAQEVGTSVATVHRTLKRHKLYPYKPNLVQHLRPADPDRRLTFIAWLVEQLEDEPDLLDRILWTDEAKFTNNGVINKQNNRFWSAENPYWTRETNHQIVWGTN